MFFVRIKQKSKKNVLSGFRFSWSRKMNKLSKALLQERELNYKQVLIIIAAKVSSKGLGMTLQICSVKIFNLYPAFSTDDGDSKQFTS